MTAKQNTLLFYIQRRGNASFHGFATIHYNSAKSLPDGCFFNPYTTTPPPRTRASTAHLSRFFRPPPSPWYDLRHILRHLGVGAVLLDHVVADLVEVRQGLDVDALAVAAQVEIESNSNS